MTWTPLAAAAGLKLSALTDWRLPHARRWTAYKRMLEALPAVTDADLRAELQAALNDHLAFEAQLRLREDAWAARDELPSADAIRERQHATWLVLRDAIGTLHLALAAPLRRAERGATDASAQAAQALHHALFQAGLAAVVRQSREEVWTRSSALLAKLATAESRGAIERLHLAPYVAELSLAYADFNAAMLESHAAASKPEQSWSDLRAARSEGTERQLTLLARLALAAPALGEQALGALLRPMAVQVERERGSRPVSRPTAPEAAVEATQEADAQAEAVEPDAASVDLPRRPGPAEAAPQPAPEPAAESEACDGEIAAK